ncbi:T6SS immunity protein Tdi1 domain-containing protein [Agromyces sp. Soil535]|uniref:T6SS immunity protein Tdi1 domain-containing protein n=1 Tax=Agromyces sp. Soil535 TaxID=1736390 RepID=UPI000B28EE29|nr:T6SS immunity protein Tdi1 domain-containing protein [Agromyces sp. Soil535]
MTTFRTFDPVAPIGEETIARFAAQVPDGVADLWRNQGAGVVGDDGFFRVVDPARAASMLEGVFGLPDGSTVLFTTALGDLVSHVNGLYLVMKSRFGAIDIIEGRSFDELVALIEDPAQRDVAWEWQPYPAARDRDGVPGFEQCFGFVPLLALGGRADVEHLTLGGLYEHLAVIAQLAGQPEVRRPLQIVSAGDAPAPGEPGSTERLIEVGRSLFAKLATDPVLNVIELPDGLGVCLVHAVRGGGKIYVAPDESVLFVGSAVDFDAGLGAFRDGVRTPREKFDLSGGGADA